MKVCFINPPHPYLKQPKAQAPLGMLYVAAAARREGCEVSYVDLGGKGYTGVYDLPEAAIYGLTGTVLDIKAITDVARYIHQKYPKAVVVLGGPITINLDDAMLGSVIDSFVLGEGEETFLRVVADHPNVKRVYAGRRILDLDDLPFPARDLLGSDLGGDIFAGRKRYFEGGSTVIATSRGCPFACTFCASPRIWGRKIVYRSAESIAAEIDHVVERYGVRQLRFSDDNLTADKTQLEKMCDHLQGREIAWRASIRVRPNSVELFEHMKSAGCAEVCFGIESGDHVVLRALKKGASVEDNRVAIINAKKAGLAVRILFMIGTPGQTVDTVKRNIAFLESVKGHYDSIAITNFTPLPGCAIADDPRGHGCRPHDTWSLRDFNLCLWGPGGMNEWKDFILPDNMSIEQLRASKKEMVQYVLSTGKSNQG